MGLLFACFFLDTNSMTLKMEAVCSSETAVNIYQITRLQYQKIIHLNYCVTLPLTRVKVYLFDLTTPTHENEHWGNNSLFANNGIGTRLLWIQRNSTQLVSGAVHRVVLAPWDLKSRADSVIRRQRTCCLGSSHIHTLTQLRSEDPLSNFIFALEKHFADLGIDGESQRRHHTNTIHPNKMQHSAQHEKKEIVK
jgi:hypothetical protein